jgi:YfiH family protein
MNYIIDNPPTRQPLQSIVSQAPVLQASSLSKYPGLRHAFFTRDGGVSQGVYATLNGGVGSNDTPGNVVENRSRMAAMLGVAPDRFLTAYQIHSPDVVTVTAPWDSADRPRVDALATQVPGIALGISTADCGPVLFADNAARVIGAAHAGWRGAFTGVIEATIAAMEKLGARRDRIAVALGPMIRQANYEVGPEFVVRFRDADEANMQFFAPGERDGHAMFDLAGYIAARLRRAGVTQVEDIGLCTYADPARFYSYRRMTRLGETDYGRHINAIALDG